MSDLIDRQAVLKLLYTLPPEEAITKAMLIQNVKYMSAAQPEKRTDERTGTHACDLIDRQAALKALKKNRFPGAHYIDTGVKIALREIKALPSAQPEPLTDKEQRIFLAAMGREEKVCKEVDEEYRDCREPYEDSLVKVCREIMRKVKGALWT